MKTAVSLASSDVPFWAMAIVANVSVGLLIAFGLDPTVKLPMAEWHCTASHAAQRAVQTATGSTTKTVYACDQWSRR